MWKIKNTTNSPVKLAVAKSNTVTLGLFLKPGEFCVCDSRMTASIDAQERRKLIEIDRSYSNDMKLKLCETYNESALVKAAEETKNYTK